MARLKQYLVFSELKVCCYIHRQSSL